MPRLSTGKVGAVSELIVSAELTKQGYDVCRAVSQAAPFDLAIFKDGVLQSAEVRTGFRNKDGRINYVKANIRADRIFVVLDGVVHEMPKAL